MKAGQLLDVLEDGRPININFGGKKRVRKKFQKEGLSNVCFVGHDVKSLFPSMKSVETARLARYAVLNSKIEIDNFDHSMALRYLFVVGGKELINKVGLS